MTRAETRGRKPKYPPELVASVKARWNARPTYKSLAAELGCSTHAICAMLNDVNERRRKRKNARRAKAS